MKNEEWMNNNNNTIITMMKNLPKKDYLQNTLNNTNKN